MTRKISCLFWFMTNFISKKVAGTSKTKKRHKGEPSFFQFPPFFVGIEPVGKDCLGCVLMMVEIMS